MESTSKLWDLNYEAESPEKADFLYYQDAPKTISCKEKGEGDAENQITWKGKGWYTKIGPDSPSTLRLH